MSFVSRSLVAMALVFALSASIASAQSVVKFYPHTGVIEEVNPAGSKAFTDFGGVPTDTLTTGNITFRFFIEDIRLNNNIGFDGSNGAAALARTKDALTYIASVLNIPAARSLDILLDVSETDGTGFLASAGTFFSAADGFFDGSAFTRLNTGTKPFAGNEEIGVTVDFGHSWNFTTNAPGGGEVDFLSVILHEITHGLGIASLSTANGNSAFFGTFGTQTFTSWDDLLTRGDGGTLVWVGNPPTINNVADLTSNNLFFNGPQSRTNYNQGGVAPGVFAPGSYQQGSSIGHWDTGNIVGGAVMEHAISSGVQQRSYTPVEIGALIDLGYTNAAGTGEGEGEGEGEGALFNFCDVLSVNITSPAADIILGPGGTNTLVSYRAQVTTQANGSCIPGTVQVGYTINGANGGSSTNSATNFLSTQNLSTGNYTLIATAELLETGTFVTDQISFNITATAADPDIDVNPNPASGFAFGEVSEGSSVDQTFTVTNVGGGTLAGQASAAGNGYSIVGSANYSLDAGQSATITVRFAPTGGGNFNGTLSFNGDPDGILQIVLSGIGLKNGIFGCGTAPSGSAGGDLALVALLGIALSIAGVVRRQRLG